MKKIRTSTIIIIGVLLLSPFSVSSQTKTELKTEVIKNSTIKKTYHLKDFKQSCCSGIVNYSLNEVKGFIKSKPDVKNQKLTVWYDRTKCTEEEIKKAINKTSYKIVN